MATKGSRFEVAVAKWGNSLAVLLPAETAKRLGVGEGDTLIAEVATNGRLILAREGSAINKVDVPATPVCRLSTDDDAGCRENAP